MVRRIRHRTNRGTANRYDGRLDYELPSPWDVNNIVNYTSGQDILATLSDTATSVPLKIENQGSPGEGRNDDDDGNPYDILFWEVDSTADFGFAQEIYVFREPATGGSGVIENIPIVPGSSIKAVTIIIEDFNSVPVEQGVASPLPIAATEGDDFSVYSTPNDDVLFGLEGGDNLFGGAGNDWINGGSDADRLIGLSGDDQLYGESQNDSLQGFTGKDALYGGSGNDVLFGGSEDDSLYGGSGDDVLDGDEGSDRLEGETGNDTYYITADTTDTIVEQADQGIDTVRSAFSYTLPANVEWLILTGPDAVTGIGNELDNVIVEDQIDSSGSLPPLNNTILAGSGNDLVRAGGGQDTVNGEAGNDRLAGWYGTDTLTGGTGADEFIFATNFSSYSPGTDGVDVITDFNQAEGDKLVIPLSVFNTASSLSEGLLPAANFRVGASATSASQHFIYNPATGEFFHDFDGLGGFGQSKIAQLATGLALTSSDIKLVGGFTLPTISASIATPIAGQTLTGTNGNDRQIGGEGNDTINGLAGDDQASGQEGNDTINGGEGQDFLNGDSGNDVVSGEAGDDVLHGEAGDDTLNGGSSNDTLSGGKGNDSLAGGLGIDRFNFYSPATGGIDQISDFNAAEDQIGLYVGENLDTAFADAGFALNTAITADQFRIGAAAADSSDRIIYNNVTGALLFDGDGTGATAAVQIATLAAGLSLTANNLIAFDETNAKAPATTGTTGDDVLTGGGTDDVLTGGGGNDTLTGGDGDDDLDGGDGNDTLKGGAAKDILQGFSGNDRLSGGDGNDRLEGGSGRDRLDGGPGNDTLKGGKDRDIFVLSRGPGRDRIEDFRDKVDRLGLTPKLKFKQLEIEQQGRNTLVSFGSKDPLALLVGVQAEKITAADFVRVSSV